MRGLVHVGTLRLVAGVANLRLGGFGKHFVAVDVNFMAVVASHIRSRMLAT
jgi:hypothetical protein